MPTVLLEVAGISVTYGKVVAISDVSLSVRAGEIVTIIGANGAGKSTTLRAISGLAGLSGGEIRFEGERISGLPAAAVAAKGVSHVPEGRRVFPDMTVEENLRTGAFLRTDRPGIRNDLDELFATFPNLLERRTTNAKALSGGEQQMLAIGRALMARPRLLLMDEPSMGLAPVVVDEIAAIIRRINADGVPVVLVEQNAQLALTLADHAYVLENGRVFLKGVASELQDDEHVRSAYLGI